MLCIILMKPRTDIQWTECAKQSMSFQWPKEAGEVVAEYNLMGVDPFYIGIFKADDISQVVAAALPWMPFFECRTYPACTIQEMREISKQAFAAMGMG
jgi:hypothetical protein